MLVLYLKLPDELDKSQWESLLLRLPVEWQREINGFKDWRDRQARLLGKLLVGYGLEKYASVTFRFADLKQGKWGRPYLDCGWDFNLSHSREYLVLGMTRGGRVGVDVEQIREVDPVDYRPFVSPEIWQEIVGGANPVESLFLFWTRIESVLKADGRGMSIPPCEVSIRGKAAWLDGKKWCLRDLFMIPGHACSVAVDSQVVDVEVIEVDGQHLILNKS